MNFRTILISFRIRETLRYSDLLQFRFLLDKISSQKSPVRVLFALKEYYHI